MAAKTDTTKLEATRREADQSSRATRRLRRSGRVPGILYGRGQDPVAVGVCGIAHNAIRHTRAGRRLGNHSGGRSVMDVQNPKAGCTVRPLQDWAIGDRRWSPAEEAAFRCDFAAWIATLPRRRRRVAELLAEGHGTGEVSQRLGITPAAVSLARRWLETSWRNYQGEAPALSP